MGHLVLDKHYDVEFVEQFFLELLWNDIPTNAMLAKFRADLIANKLNASRKWTAELKAYNMVKVWNYYAQGKCMKVYAWREAEGKVEFLDNPNYGLEMLS